MDYLSSLYQPRREKWRRSFVSGGRTSANRGNFVAATSTVTLPPRLEGSEVAYPRFAEDNSPFLYQLGRPTPSPFADFVATDTSNLQPSPLSFSPIVKIAEESREEWSLLSNEGRTEVYQKMRVVNVFDIVSKISRKVERARSDNRTMGGGSIGGRVQDWVLVLGREILSIKRTMDGRGGGREEGGG